VNDYLDRRFMLIMLFSFIFLVGYLTAVANQTYTTASIQTANKVRQAIEEERQTITAQEIFLNNLIVSISLTVPLIGLIPFLVTWHNTAVTIGLLSKAYAIPPTTSIMNLITLAFPELLAYTVIMSENIYVSLLTILRLGAKQRVTSQSWKSLILYLILLWIGAITEVMCIA